MGFLQALSDRVDRELRTCEKCKKVEEKRDDIFKYCRGCNQEPNKISDDDFCMDCRDQYIIVKYLCKSCYKQKQDKSL